VGNSTLLGGTGNDTYVLFNPTTVVTENSNEGIDTVQIGYNYTLGSNVENLTLTGTGNLLGVGNSLVNTLTANTGTDTLVGGVGNDTYIVQNSNTVITENFGEGTDTVQTNINYTLGSELENLTLTGSDNLSGTANNLNNYITGNAGNNLLNGFNGNDTLDGAAGADSMYGGAHDDTYIVDNVGDLVIENPYEGIDTVSSNINYTLTTEVENLTLLGSNNLVGVGNELNNLLTGNDGNNSLDGSSGNDTLIGGAGDDSYYVDSQTDIVTENANAGVDTVYAYNTGHTLGSNVENLTLTGYYALVGQGNSLDNVITGNVGDSTLVGGTGNDTYVLLNNTTVITENASAGTDTVQIGMNYTLGTNLENLTLTGTNSIVGVGNAYNNIMTDNNAASTLSGGLGNDTYVVQNSDTIITENTGEGTDTVQSSINYTLNSNVENLTVTGSGNLNGTGNSLNNLLTGNNATNTLVTLSGNDTLDGGAGADSMYGGTNDDTYIVDNLGDLVFENASEGTDSVQSSVSYSLGSNVENLVLTGASNLNGTGNSLSNTLTGNAGNNALDGGTGADTLIGGQGDDTYVVDNASDVITETSGQGTDTVQTSISWTLASNLENITLLGTNALTGTGNSANNILTSLNNAPSTLSGGTGNDTYIIKNAITNIVESSGAGTDTVQIGTIYTLGANLENLVLTGVENINGFGNSLANTITGNFGNNSLDGGTGNDTLIGGLGDDIYVVDSNSDIITENSGEGIDQVFASTTYTLSSYVENLTLTGTSNLNGTGNIYSNLITGNAGKNSLVGADGDDTLDGGVGADTLVGGIGNDLYIVDNTLDVLVENGGEGIDSVRANASYILANYFENLTLVGSDSINGTGNDFANTILGNNANNILTGLGGNDTLDGGIGADTLSGGIGDDTYFVDNSGDVIVENLNGGIDTVNASINYALGKNIENLYLLGSATAGSGNSDNNTLLGNDSNNTLDGAAGADLMVGGLGDDTYIVDNANDIVFENQYEGLDTAQASVDYILSDNVNNLTLTGSVARLGKGNVSDNNIVGNTVGNLLYGYDGNDTLDGGTGADTLIGGTGNDTYVVENIADVVIENAGEGIDTIQSSVTHHLEQNTENLTLTGVHPISFLSSIQANPRYQYCL